MPLKILIIGAGVCGPAFATILRRADPSLSKYDITIVERAPKLRQSGLQIDIRAQGIPVVRKMGLIEAIRKRVVPENGLKLVDKQGRDFAPFGKNDTGQGSQSMTSEYEIMRGDLVDVFYRASLGLNTDKDDNTTTTPPTTDANNNVRYLFNTTVTSLTQTSPSSSVSATFSTGQTSTYDLVVGADGQWSHTRRAVLGDSMSDRAASDACFHPLDLYTALYVVPRDPATDDGWMRVHLMPGKRAAIIRSADTKAPTQVYLVVQTSRKDNAYGLAEAMGAGPASHRRAWARAFVDYPGWRVGAFVDALKKGDTMADSGDGSGKSETGGNGGEGGFDDYFYATEIGQVRCDKLVSGRIVLLGDAGYCPSPITGMGTTLSLSGAYILAGELARHQEKAATSDGSDGGVVAALQSYERVVRPFVTEAQRLAPGFPRILYAESNWGVWVRNTIIWLISLSGIFDLLVRFLPEDKGGLPLPEYPELKLVG